MERYFSIFVDCNRKHYSIIEGIMSFIRITVFTIVIIKVSSFVSLRIFYFQHNEETKLQGIEKFSFSVFRMLPGFQGCTNPEEEGVRRET